MIALPLGRCRNCGDDVSYFARSCPTCYAANLPNPVATVAALGAVVLVGGVIGLGLLAVRGKSGPQSQPQADHAPEASNPATNTAKDYGWVVTAMAECEEEAK